jgi:hypothetical protein
MSIDQHLTAVGRAAVTGRMTVHGFMQILGEIAGSAISTAVLSTFVSAFAGTWGAQILAEKTARRKELLHEIRGVNVAIGFAFNIANTYIVTKKQHIRGIVTAYKGHVAARQAHDAGRKAGTIPAADIFTYKIELRTISPPFSPIEGLQKTFSDRITPDGKAVILLTPLIQCIQGFADVAAQRNAWIAEFKNLPDNADTDTYKAALYFGIPYAPRRVDDRYPTLIEAIEVHTDDCIAYSILIAESLQSMGIGWPRSMVGVPPESPSRNSIWPVICFPI